MSVRFGSVTPGSSRQRRIDEPCWSTPTVHVAVVGNVLQMIGGHHPQRHFFYISSSGEGNPDFLERQASRPSLELDNFTKVTV